KPVHAPPPSAIQSTTPEDGTRRQPPPPYAPRQTNYPGVAHGKAHAREQPEVVVDPASPSAREAEREQDEESQRHPALRTGRNDRANRNRKFDRRTGMHRRAHAQPATQSRNRNRKEPESPHDRNSYRHPAQRIVSRGDRPTRRRKRLDNLNHSIRKSRCRHRMQHRTRSRTRNQTSQIHQQRKWQKKFERSTKPNPIP